MAALCLLALLISACGTAGVNPATGPSAAGSSSPASPVASEQSPTTTGTALFIAARGEAASPDKPEVIRARLAKINHSLLLDAQGNAIQLPANSEITLNLFPDTVYTGVIEEIQEDGGSYTWVGHLKGVETSELFIVYTAGVFIGHFASPLGVYEVSSTGGDRYEIIQIDQNRLPGGEGDRKVPTTGP